MKTTTQLLLTRLKISSTADQAHFCLYGLAAPHSRRSLGFLTMTVAGYLERRGPSTRVEMSAGLGRASQLIAGLGPVLLLAPLVMGAALPPHRLDPLLKILPEWAALCVLGYMYFRPTYRAARTQLALLIQAALTGAPEMPANLSRVPPVDTRPVHPRDKVFILAMIVLLLGAMHPTGPLWLV